MRLLRTVAALTVICLGAAGCQARDAQQSDGDVAGRQPEMATPPTTAPEAPGSAPEDPHGGLGCDEQTLEAINAQITRQMQALAAGDYETALGFTTNRYRSRTTLEAYRDLVEGDYPVLTRASGHTSSLCAVQDSRAQLLVTVQPRDAGRGAQDLVYEMVLESGQWRVDVFSSPRDAPREGSSPVDV